MYELFLLAVAGGIVGSYLVRVWQLHKETIRYVLRRVQVYAIVYGGMGYREAVAYRRYRHSQTWMDFDKWTTIRASMDGMTRHPDSLQAKTPCCECTRTRSWYPDCARQRN